VLDVQMPDVDGFELARRIRDDARHADLPLIMATSAGQDHEAAQSRALRVTRHLAKPILERVLFEPVREALGAPQPRSAVPPPASPRQQRSRRAPRRAPATPAWPPPWTTTWRSRSASRTCTRRLPGS